MRTFTARMHCAVQKVCRRLTCKHCARRGEQGEVMTLTILSVAYPLASVGPDAVGGAEQILTYAIHEAIREEATSFDFLCGRENYKYRWGAVDQLVYRKQLTRSDSSKQKLTAV